MVKLLFHFLNGKDAPCVCWEAANLGCDHSRSSAFFLNLYLPSSNKFIGLLGLDSFCLHAWSVHLTLDQPRSNRINLSLTMSLLSCVNSLSFKTGLSLSVRGLFNQAPNYQRAIQAGKNARHHRFALWVWRGDDLEGYFGDLGAWAQRRIKELVVDLAIPCIVYNN